ncbi:hypothetical protein [Nocardia sp. NPDC004722]
MNLPGVQQSSHTIRKIGAFAGAIAAMGTLAACGGGDGGGTTPNTDKGQMEANLRAVMSAKSPSDVTDKFCTQYSDLIKNIPAEVLSNASTVRPKGELTKLEKVEITGDKATAEATGKKDSGGDYSGPVTFKNENGQWKYCPDLGFTMPTMPGK